jgi:putative membrane protein
MTNFSPQENLARGRNHQAADRSLLSFMRSSLTLISIGVGIEQIISAITPNGHFSDILAYGLSLLFVGLGVVTLGLAIQDYQGELKRLQAPVYRYTPRRPLGGTIGLTVLAVGTLAFLGLGLNL